MNYLVPVLGANTFKFHRGKENGTLQLKYGTGTENNFKNTYKWLWLGVATKLYGKCLAGYNNKNRKKRKCRSSFKGEDREVWWRRFTFPELPCHLSVSSV